MAARGEQDYGRTMLEPTLSAIMVQIADLSSRGQHRTPVAPTTEILDLQKEPFKRQNQNDDQENGSNQQ